MSLLTPADVRQLADSLGIRPTKQLGQNFVIDAGTVRRIVRTAGVEEGDSALEIGPGLGSLTLALLEAGASVSAVEIDPALAAALPGTVAGRNEEWGARLAVALRDALTITGPDDIPLPPGAASPTKLVANLPYNVATPVVLTLLPSLPALTDVLVMVQAEVADRMAAGPGSKVYGAPSVKIAWYGQAARAGTISRTVFWPAPNVDSALVRILRRKPPRTTATREEVFAVVDAAFAQRRKTLRAALAGWAGTAAAAEDRIRAAGIDPQRRGETLTIEEFCAIAGSAAPTP